MLCGVFENRLILTLPRMLTFCHLFQYHAFQAVRGLSERWPHVKPFFYIYTLQCFAENGTFAVHSKICKHEIHLGWFLDHQKHWRIKALKGTIPRKISGLILQIPFSTQRSLEGQNESINLQYGAPHSPGADYTHKTRSQNIFHFTDYERGNDFHFTDYEWANNCVENLVEYQISYCDTHFDVFFILLCCRVNWEFCAFFSSHYCYVW